MNIVWVLEKLFTDVFAYLLERYEKQNVVDKSTFSIRIQHKTGDLFQRYIHYNTNMYNYFSFPDDLPILLSAK